jgi:heat shock protein HslJ
MPRAILALLLGLSAAAPAVAQTPRFGPSVVVELAGQTLGYTPARPVAPPPAVPEPVAPEPQALPRPTLGIEGDRASGTTGCNQWTGTVSWSTRGAMRFGPIATTKMACSPALMAQERAFLDALKRTTRAERRGMELSLYPRRGARLMRLHSISARADQAPTRP